MGGGVGDLRTIGVSASGSWSLALPRPACRASDEPRSARTEAVALAWGGAVGEYRDDELDVVDDDELALIDVANLGDRDDD